MTVIHEKYKLCSEINNHSRRSVIYTNAFIILIIVFGYKMRFPKKLLLFPAKIELTHLQREKFLMYLKMFLK